MTDKAKICTLSGRPAEEVRKEQTEKTGQYKDYIVLCQEELDKGFVRPFRNKYIHVGRSICAKTTGTRHKGMLGAPRHICALPHQHKGECDGPFISDIDQYTQSQLLKSHRKGGCGTETRMNDVLSASYARDPKFYGATFCVGCNKHLPVGEFVWSQDGEVVGS